MEGPASAEDCLKSPLATGASHQAVILLTAVAVLTVALLAEVQQPTRVTIPALGLRLPTLCIWNRLLGVTCPGCGLTRSVTCLAHGDAAAAWQFHAAGWAVFAWLIIQIPYRSINLYRIFQDRQPLPAVAMTAANWAVLVCVFATWAGRNLMNP